MDRRGWELQAAMRWLLQRLCSVRPGIWNWPGSGQGGGNGPFHLIWPRFWLCGGKAG